jgi:multidrug resistance efflux pump
MKNGRFGIVIIAVLIVLAALLAVLGPKLVDKRPQQAAPAPGAPRPAGVTARGVVEAAEEVELTSQVKGVVSRVLVEEGVPVHKGDLLLEFDRAKIDAQRQQVRAGLAAAESRLREASAGYRSEDTKVVNSAQERAKAVYDRANDDYGRQLRLFDKGAATRVELNQAQERLKIAESELSGANANLTKQRVGVRSETLDQSKADLERARADLQLVDSTLRDYRVYAPISGIVIERHKVKGEGADIGTPLFHLINPATFRIRAELEETDIGRVTEGQPVEVTVEAFTGKTYQGKVSRVFPVVHKKSQKSFDPMASFDINTQKIQVILDNYSGLRDGMSTTVRFK